MTIDDLITSLTKLGEETCQLLQEHPYPLREWTRYVPKDGGNASFPVEQRPDPIGISYLVFSACENATTFQQVIDDVLRVPIIADHTTINGAEQPIADGPMRRWWIHQSFVMPLLSDYFLSRGTFTFDLGSFEQLVREHIAELSLDVSTEIAITPLFNLQMNQESVEITPSIRLRKLRPNEIEKWLNPQLPLFGPIIPADLLMNTQSTVETEERHPALGADASSHLVSTSLRVLEIVRFVTDGYVFPLFTEVRTHGGPRIHGIHTTPYPLPSLSGIGNPARINDEVAPQISQLWKYLETSPNLPVVSLARRRWKSASERQCVEDRLIDSWIGLESIFAPDSTQEVRYRCALRIARFLRQSGPERNNLFHNIQMSYDWRSAIVHGGTVNSRRSEKLSNKMTLGAAANSASATLREAIVKIVRMKHPFTVQEIDTCIVEDAR